MLPYCTVGVCQNEKNCCMWNFVNYSVVLINGRWRWKSTSDLTRTLQREKKNVTELPGLDSNSVSQEMINKALGKHITPITLKSTIKRNPLYSDIQVDDDWEKKKTPSWTVQDYDRHSLHSNLASHIKVTRWWAAFEQSWLLRAVCRVHEPLCSLTLSFWGIPEVSMNIFSGTDMTLNMSLIRKRSLRIWWGSRNSISAEHSLCEQRSLKLQL